MKLLPIRLGIARKIGNAQKRSVPAGMPAGMVQDPARALAEITPKILKRDKNTCRFCGFKADKYQKILILNQDPDDIRPANLATSCIFCHQCFNLDQVSSMRSGALIWAPEITQSELNQIAKAIYVARISQGPMADAARKSLDILMGRREEAKNRLGSDDPYILSMVLKDYLGNKSYATRLERLKGVRLLPLDRRTIKEGDLEFNQFPQILAYWRSKEGPFGELPPNKWLETLENSTAAQS